MQHLITLIDCHVLDHEDKYISNFMAIIWSPPPLFLGGGVVRVLFVQAVFCLFVKKIWQKMSGNNSIIVGRVWPFLGT